MFELHMECEAFVLRCYLKEIKIIVEKSFGICYNIIKNDHLKRRIPSARH